jgi:uncharacterized protein YcgI (DUF1989 family)
MLELNEAGTRNRARQKEERQLKTKIEIEKHQRSSHNTDQHVMGQPITSMFIHRRNQDGSHDSICTQCVSMVASVESEGELSSHELIQVCDRANTRRVNRGDDLPSPKSSMKTG